MIIRNWKIQQLKSSKPSFAYALFSTFANAQLYGPLLLLLLEECFLRVVQALMLGQVLRYLSQRDSAEKEREKEKNVLTFEWACLNATGLLLTTLFLLTMHNHVLLRNMRTGMRAKVAASAAIYRKLLRLSHTSSRATSSGQLVNLLSSDLGRVDDFVCVAPYLLIAPLQTVIILSILWTYLGTAGTAVGFALLLMLIPLQGLTGKFAGRLRYQN